MVGRSIREKTLDILILVAYTTVDFKKLGSNLFLTGSVLVEYESKGPNKKG